MNKGYKRKNYFIKKNFQGKLILSYFLFVIGGCLFFIVLLGLFSADSLTINYKNYDIQMGQTPLMLFKEVIAAHWVFLIVGGTLLVIASMFLTHRIAGPFFRFEKTLDTMSLGNLDDVIYLRKKDEGKDLAEKINTFNEFLSSKIRSIHQHSQKIDDLYSQYNHLNNKKNDPDEIAAILQSIKKHNDIIQEISNSFTLKNE